jgi:threonine dehydrogenase-like Zn-dependent dehydrogenase
MRARALWTVAPGRCELREETLGTDGVLVRAVASGISRGTEALVFAGRVPPSQYQAMKAPLMAGEFPFPVKYGYSIAGRDESGRRVFVLHPHQDRFRVPEAMCVPIPTSVPDHRAVLAANMETALNIVWDAQPIMGERVLVVGAGVVGLLAASLLARHPACRVTVTDTNPTRADAARAMGAEFVPPDCAPADQDLIVHASGSEAGLRTSLAAAATEARIVEASWYGTAAPALPLGEAFHARRLRLISSQVGQVGGPMRGRRTTRDRLALALDLLAAPSYDLLLEPPTPFADLPEAMPRLLAGGLCHVVTYGS